MTDPAAGPLLEARRLTKRYGEMLGYSDQTVFSRAFSRRFGHPPSQMRKMPR